MRIVPLLFALIPATAFAQAPGQTPPLASGPRYLGAATAPALRSGLTFDTSIGIGVLHIPQIDGDGDSSTDVGFAGTMGIGAFLSPTFALSLRLTTLTCQSRVRR